ncbi:4-aminobutyrate--2-oxoglutarate transaminase [Corallincola spongiicola]|uniref:4-aminobutyrate--2-oxoglutarate transaminase n=1 Tax=Corallincola spongiicola TaxID=2520508 RepID=A0ABY1WPW5_9GAMM|nr:4-aminobutyrate--2-oxoglutarate transaminase [Corallincola spongiicola]TAA45973.1 4-aminobutyrate--2-oxoglutarate transaminase [Corallincola spongiicola]
MSANAALQTRKNQAIARGMGNSCPVFVAKAKNAELWDQEGRRFIDLGAGIAVNNTGHCHPRVIAAVEQQLHLFTHTCAMVTPYEAFVALAEQLNQRAPGDTPKKSIFLSTGAEAVENSIKIARAYTGRSGVIAFKGGFHGRTHYSMGLTGKNVPYKHKFGPFPAEIFHAPYPNALHGISEAQSLQALAEIFACDIEPSRVAAIIFEPVQGEGGFYAAPAPWAQALRKLCDEHGILLICDEIQTGFARTGTLFACDKLGIEPDMMTLAKGIAGGFPLSAVVGKSEIMDAPEPGGLGGTYAGNPLACVAGLEVLKVIDEEQLCDKAMAIGEAIHNRFSALREEVQQLADVRAFGAMVAIEFNTLDGAPDPVLTKQLVARACDAGVILLSCGVKGNVIRFLPPLTIEPEVLQEGLNRVIEVLRTLIIHRAS